VIRADLEHLDAIVLLFSVARYLERLADHATNIAEDVLYMVEGEIQRHNQAAVAPGTAEELLELGDLGCAGQPG
jgi:phosphate uptake regulator